MKYELLQDLSRKVQTYSGGYVRSLAAAEQAVSAGQFNLAKVLRAAAHAQRSLALQAARLTVDPDPTRVLASILQESATGEGEQYSPAALTSPVSDQPASLDRFRVVEQQLGEISMRALVSLRDNPDVLESAIHQHIWGCYGCGNLVEGDLPDACPVCGALSIEFEWFGPFYSTTPEHLGQRTPPEILAILENNPAQVEGLLSDLEDDVLGKKPSGEEWSIKEILGHIHEVEKLFLKRAHSMLAKEDGAELPSSPPPWTLHEGKGYENWPVSDLLRQFRETRAVTLALLASLTGEDWIRTGSNAGSPVSLLDLGTWLANHDTGHIAQLQRDLPLNPDTG